MKIGVLGAGQLGRMLALAAYPLGIQVRCYDPVADSPAAPLAEFVTAPYDDADAISRFVNGLDLITYEFENVPRALVEALVDKLEVLPPPAALGVAQDRVEEKSLFAHHGIPSAQFCAVDEARHIAGVAVRVGFPCLLKTRRLGYDGKGQALLRDADEADGVAARWGDVPSIVERFIPFERELSLICVRGRQGETRFYPLVENFHEQGILRVSIAPAENLGHFQRDAQKMAMRVMDALGYVGVLAIEFFVHNGRLLANEMAPRVHNSGHWTVEGAVTSQFENHLRAIAGWPLGDTAPRGHSAMVNIIGTLPDARDVLRMADAHLHLYGKAPRPGRKLGHVTVCASDAPSLAKRIKAVQALCLERVGVDRR